MTTFVRSAGSQTQGVWKFLEKASQTDAGVSLAELEHPSLKKMALLPRGKGYYLRSLFILQIRKVQFLMDVGWVSKDGWVTTELGTGSLR